MRVLTDADGYVTLRLSEFPNTAFDIETEVYDLGDGLEGSVTLVPVVPSHDPLLEDTDSFPELEALAVQLHGQEKAREIALRLERERQRDIAIAEQAAQARAAAIARKFGAGAGSGSGSGSGSGARRSDVPKAG